MSEASEQLNRHLVEALLSQQQKELRWKKWRFFLLLVPSLLLLLFYAALLADLNKPDLPEGEAYAALVRVEGEIGPGKPASAEQINPLLEKAFKDNEAKGIVLIINSPGGTPVQAALIRDRLLQLRAEYPNRKLVVVGEDMLTSGAYLIATGSDRIYVNRSTLTGSIGVIMRGFGFVDAAKKLGIERRVYTAGQNKNRLDPFIEAEPEDLQKIQGLLSKVHQHFMDAVEQGRGNRLKGDKKDLFSGDFWTGEEAVSLGLVDAVQDLPTTLKRDFSVKSVREYQPKQGLLERFSQVVGTELSQHWSLSSGSRVEAIAAELLP